VFQALPSKSAGAWQLQCTAQAYHPDQRDWFPYLACIIRDAREKAGEDVKRLHEACAHDADLNSDDIWKCGNGEPQAQYQYMTLCTVSDPQGCWPV
jgi:hypothetical protein